MPCAKSLQGQDTEALDAVIGDQGLVARDMGQIFDDDTAVIDRVVVIGFENGNFAKCRKRRELRVRQGGFYGFLDMLELA